MSNAVEGVSLSGASSMTKLFENPLGGAEGAGQTPSLSHMAEAALSGIEKLQADMGNGMKPAAEPAPTIDAITRPGEADRVPEGMLGAQAQILAEQIQASTQVQMQLARFVMASSVSSSLGRNLNMFLRGQ